MLLQLDVEHRRQRHVVDIRVHADRVHDHVEGNGDRTLHQRVLALNDQAFAVRRHFGDACLDVLDLILLLALPVILALVEAEGADIHVVDVDAALRQRLADLHRQVRRHRAADFRAPLAADLAVARADAEENGDPVGRAPVGWAAHALAGGEHLLDLRGGDDVGIGAEAPFRLVDRVEVRKAGAEDGRTRLDLRPVGQRRVEIAGAADEGLDRRILPDIDELVALDPPDHAADRVLRPFAARHQFGIARQDRRAAESVGFIDQHDALPGRSQRMGGG